MDENGGSQCAFIGMDNSELPLLEIKGDAVGIIALYSVSEGTIKIENLDDIWELEYPENFESIYERKTEWQSQSNRDCQYCIKNYFQSKNNFIS